MSNSPHLTAAPLLNEYTERFIRSKEFISGKQQQNLWQRGQKFTSDRGLYVDQLSDQNIWSVFLVVSLPVEELLCEAVLHVAGWGLLLDPTLQ